MEILITGANGYLGKNLISFLEKDHNITKFNRQDFNLLNETCQFEIDKKYDLVIHAMGRAHTVPVDLIEAGEFYKVNVLSTINLLNALLVNKPKNFVYISSVSVYGITEGNDISENAATLANDPYGLSKIIAEKIIKFWCQNNNIKCTILRLPLVVGKNPPGNLGNMINSIQRKKFYYFNKGIARKSMVLAEDVARFIIPASNVGGTFNLTDQHHPSFKELSYSIAISLNMPPPKNLPFFIAKSLAFIGDIIGKKFPINSKLLSKMINDLTFDDSLAQKSFGWKPCSTITFFTNDNLI